MTSPELPGVPRPKGAPLLSGILAGRYRIDRQIGEGGMATVYLARDLTRDVDVAVKAPKQELVAQLGPERFAREIQITTQLQHPYIVAVLDSGMADGVPFYIMPFIDCETLEQRLRRSGEPLPIGEAITFAVEILEALAYAHRLGFVHRDVKPSNIMLLHGHAMLADFGIARAAGTADGQKLTESGFVLGTAEYMSPEQAAGEAHLDGRSDIYSVGCILYEMLVAAPPFTAPNSRAVMARHFVDPVPSIRTVRETVPEVLEQAVFTALAKTPVDRFPTADAFRDALKDPAMQVTGAISQGRSAALARGAAARRRWWGRVAAAAGTLAVAAAAIVWRQSGRDTGSLDQHRVMVYPFVTSGPAVAGPNLGEDVATIIGNALDGAEPLRWVDGWAHLDRATRDDISLLSLADARKIARSKRCGTFVMGRLVPAGDSTRVSLTLYDAQSGTERLSGSATGIAAEPWRQGLKAFNGVLTALIPGNVRSTSDDWKDRNPSAVANFLIGEGAFRRAQVRDALAAYRKAVALDSTFAIAALRGAQAAAWIHKGEQADAMVRVAFAQPLSPRYRHFAEGFLAYRAGNADSAAAHLTAATVADPEFTVAWMQLGEVYTHLLPLKGNPDSLADLAFARARALDSSATTAMFHPIEIRLRRGDIASATPLLERFRAALPDSNLLKPLDIAADCVRRGATAVDWNRYALSEPLALLAAARSISGGAQQLPCARAAYSAMLALDTAATDDADARRFASLVGLQGVYLAAGRPRDAVDAIDRFVTRWNQGASLYLLDAVFFEPLRGRGLTVARDDEATHGPRFESLPYNLRLWELGVLHAQHGRVPLATAIAAELRRRAGTSDSTRVKALSQSLDAFVLLAAGDSATAERSFASFIATGSAQAGVEWDEAASKAAERMVLVQLLIARRAWRDAIDVATVFESPWPQIYRQYVPASLELRAQAAAALGRPAEAAQYRARVAAIHSALK